MGSNGGPDRHSIPAHLGELKVVGDADRLRAKLRALGIEPD
jgi:hypothetical protein